MSKRIVVGMSGGVDSSLAAALLHEQGYEVVGVTLKLWPCGTGQGDDPEDACASPTDARAVAASYDLAHYVVDFEDRFREGVIHDFINGYRSGETPNPCVGCNERIKFRDLWHWGQKIGADFVATGHYARVAEVDNRLCAAVPHDLSKDQSYFLFTLNQEQLAAARFPLGDMAKADVRTAASARGWRNADRPDSQDLCFVGDDGVRGFLKQEVPDAFVPGPIELTDGRVLGEHQGLPGITIGQRKGLGVAWTEPLYVVRLEPDRNAVILGTKDEMLVDEVFIRDCHWQAITQLPADGLRCKVRTRHRAPAVPAVIEAQPDLGPTSARIRFMRHVPLPAPGQAAVAYDHDVSHVIGGGWFIRH